MTPSERRKWLADYRKKLRRLLDEQDRLDGKAVRAVQSLVRDMQRRVVERAAQAASQAAEPGAVPWGVFWSSQLQREVVQVASELAGRVGETVADYLPDSFRNGVQVADVGVQGVGITVPEIAPQVVQVASTFSADLIRDFGQRAIDAVSKEIAVSVALGEPSSKLMQRLTRSVQHRDESVFGSVAYQAERIARTEINRVQTQATQLRQEQVARSVPEIGLQKMFVAAHILEWPCELCSPHDGKVFDLNDPAAPELPLHPNCYDEETEVLTDDGWKRFLDVRGDEKVFSLDPETHIPEWTGITQKVAYHYEGPMYRFSSRVMDLRVTPDHQMYIRVRKNLKPWRLEAAHEAASRHEFSVLRSCEWEGERATHVEVAGRRIESNLFCKLMGYFLSEGSVSRWGHNGRKQIKISQEKPDSYATMARDMASLQPRLGEGAIYFFDQPLAEYLSQFGKSWEKFVPNEIKRMQSDKIRVFLDAYCLGDGHVKKGRVFNGHQFGEERSYFTSSDKMAADLGELILKAGKSPSYRLQHTGRVEFDNGTYDCRDVWVIRENNGSSCRVTPERTTIYDYSGMVGCVELERNHILLVRRSGRVAWCGNCRCRYVDFVPGLSERPAAGERAERVATGSVAGEA